ncbi:hypothetical protein MHL31_02905 [Lutibacter sp. A80]|uniref:hypothetical protein n=1 Tax=Lutibacter sp. A80 TaxID=2918453 RepID=UPI001F06FE22|nr:hypothetical protein [Lutibacter sp. A80]UMB61162.1 hypothetical protein MHL31_02905 [Lutibacter sp. A80]
MEHTQIEKLDKSRYNMLIWLTIGFSLYFGEAILKEFIDGKNILLFVRLLGVIGMVLFLKSTFMSLKIIKQIKQDSKLKQALNNELHKLYVLKSFRIGFLTFLTLIIGFMILSFFKEMPLLVVLEIILYFGMLSTFISGLIYNKN